MMGRMEVGKAETLLRTLTGGREAAFRPGQAEAIALLVEERQRVLVVQKTGWGKSAVYFIATRMLRDRGAGPTILLSPLLSLMRNQLPMAARIGLAARRIDSTNADEWGTVTDEIVAGRIDVLLISPERLGNERFRREIMPELARHMGLIVVDEAHCISDWGHDFRPDYRRIGRVIGMMPRGVPLLCTTATANDRVVSDIDEQLGGMEVLRGPLDRASLALSVVALPRQADRLAWLAAAIPELPGAGIVYCLTVDDTERVAAWLRSRGIDAIAYHGQQEDEVRVAAEAQLLGNDVKAVVATSALGMGFDKPDLGFVVHYQSPGSAVAYYQQVGRAGRSVERAEVILLLGHEDSRIQDHFITTAFPPKATALAVVDLLEGSGEALSVPEIERQVNVRRTVLENMLKVLEVDGAVERSGGRWRRTLLPWAFDDARVEGVTALRRGEQAAMREYAGTAECRMSFLRRQLDDPAAGPCGRCDNCTGRPSTVDLDRDVVAAATEFLRRRPLLLAPRLQWVSDGRDRRGRIAADRRLEEGRALSRSGDGGWGDIVRRTRHEHDRYPDELVDAAARVVGDWAPEPRPTWVTCVPSASDGDELREVARRLASRLGLSFGDVVRRTRPGPPQEQMANSAQQLDNVWAAFAVDGRPPPGPVLLLDDVVDSRWTLTVIGAALREAGSGPVHPFVLAKA
jgi:ATP-dependent DNA helicase RecQ